jgi:hypothetical protein
LACLLKQFVDVKKDKVQVVIVDCTLGFYSIFRHDVERTLTNKKKCFIMKFNNLRNEFFGAAAGQN